MHTTVKFAVLVAFGAGLLVPQYRPVFAESLSAVQGTLSQLQTQSSNLQQQIQQEQSRVQSVQSTLHKYQTSLASVQSAMVNNQQEMTGILQQLARIQREMTANQTTLASLQSDLTDHLRTIYEDGSVPYLRVLFRATSFTDLLDRLGDLEVIAQSNQALAGQIQSLQATLVEQKNQQTTEYQRLGDKQQQMASLRGTYQQLVDAQRHELSTEQRRLSDTQRRRTVLESQIQLTQAQIQQIQVQTQEANTLMQNQSYVQQQSENMKSVDMNSVVTYAQRFLGTPYAWGGTSPSGFDCSGFTQYVLGHFGVQLYRTSESQFAQGVPVSSADLQPGDLVFFSTYAPGATHVGIYIGNGLMIDAEDSGVCIAGIHGSYWGARYVGARRVMKHA